MPKSLFSAFSPNNYQDWLEKAHKDLKGHPLESLDSFTSDGLRIHPLYASDFPNQKITNQPTLKKADWVIVEEFIVADEEETNALALDKLKRGATGLLFYVYANVNLEVLLKDILFEYIPIHLVVEGSAQHVLDKWLDLTAKRGLNPAQLNGSINTDPIENAARTGHWNRDAEADLLVLKEVVKRAPKGVKTLCVNANSYGNAGATSAQQLALALSHLYEYINRFGDKYLHGLWLNMAIGGQYFEEIAKFRAMRRLWAFLLDALNLPQTDLPIYAESGFRNKTIYDPWVNILRNATQGMSAAIGGADEILLRAFNITYKVPEEFGNRIARNQQLIMAQESYLDQVKDPAAGSYFIENLTEEMAAKAWEIFQGMEEKGGLIKGLEEGWIQDMVEESARVEQMRFRAGKFPLVGSNLFLNEEEKMSEEIAEPLFGMAPQGTAIRPLVAKRLSEDLEKERLQKEELGKES